MNDESGNDETVEKGTLPTVDEEASAESAAGDPGERTPTVTCSRCSREWELSYELDSLQAGNRALEQFAMDHHRHTGHYPDGVTPWIAECKHCPDGERFLAERPTRRFARTHARHTRHTVTVEDPDGETESVQFEE